MCVLQRAWGISHQTEGTCSKDSAVSQIPGPVSVVVVRMLSSELVQASMQHLLSFFRQLDHQVWHHDDASTLLLVVMDGKPSSDYSAAHTSHAYARWALEARPISPLLKAWTPLVPILMQAL